MNPQERDLLRRTAGDLGVTLSDSQLDVLSLYMEELLIWNRRVNLIGIRSRRRVCVELLADSLAPVPLLPRGGRLLDVGSGAGLPGIPIKIVLPGLEVDLLEPSSKRQSFLRQVLRLAGLKNIRAVQGRVEDLEASPSGGWVLVTARAVAGFARVVEMCAPAVAESGLLVGFLGRNAAEELARAESAMRAHRLFLRHARPYGLPGLDGKRCVVLLEKKGGPH